MKVDVKNVKGERVGKVDLSEKVFDVKMNEKLLHDVYEAKRANRKKSAAHTKKRADKRGGGAKPWRQKGTGRARAGSSRSPLWRGGGVVFGPSKERNFKSKINKKVNKKAMAIALSEKLRRKQLVVIENFKLEDTKTKLAVKAIAKVAPKKVKDNLLIVGDDSEGALRPMSNIADAKAIRVGNINIIDLLSHDGVILEKGAVESLQKTFSG